MKGIILSIVLHLLLFAATTFLFVESNRMVLIGQNAQDQVIKIIVQQEVSPAPEVNQAVVKPKRRAKKTRKEEIVKVSGAPKQQAPRKKVTAVKGDRINQYAQQLNSFINDKKFYPRQAVRLRQHGTVKITMIIDQYGQFKDVKVTEMSRFPLLNKAAYELVSRLKKFKPLPTEYNDQARFTVPISYALK